MATMEGINKSHQRELVARVFARLMVTRSGWAGSSSPYQGSR